MGDFARVLGRWESDSVFLIDESHINTEGKIEKLREQRIDLLNLE
jgi:hypothetical protein